MTQEKPKTTQTHDEILLQQRSEFYQFTEECTACQSEIEPHWQYCAQCGTRLETECPGCGAPLPPAGTHACLNCGLEIPQLTQES